MKQKQIRYNCIRILRSYSAQLLRIYFKLIFKSQNIAKITVTITFCKVGWWISISRKNDKKTNRIKRERRIRYVKLMITKALLIVEISFWNRSLFWISASNFKQLSIMKNFIIQFSLKGNNSKNKILRWKRLSQVARGGRGRPVSETG